MALAHARASGDGTLLSRYVSRDSIDTHTLSEVLLVRAVQAMGRVPGHPHYAAG